MWCNYKGGHIRCDVTKGGHIRCDVTKGGHIRWDVTIKVVTSDVM